MTDKQTVASPEAVRLKWARELLLEIARHEFIPGEYPDADYCSCGRRWRRNGTSRQASFRIHLLGFALGNSAP